MLDLISVEPKKKQNVNSMNNTEKNSKNQGEILEHNVKFLLTHYEEMNGSLYESSTYKIKEIVSVMIGNSFSNFHS